jgi:cell division protein FtsL
MKSRAQRIREDRIRADRRSAVRILTVVMIGIFVLVGMRSYAAIIQHENNILERENEYIQAEIDSLQSQIVDETRVTRIEDVATQQFGMVYPSTENVVKLGNAKPEVENLAAAIRSEAYN